MSDLLQIRSRNRVGYAEDSNTKFLTDPPGGLTLTVTGTATSSDVDSVEMSLVNPHGDVSATIPNTENVAAEDISAINATDEYGQPTTPNPPTTYGWEGAAQRSRDTLPGLILMGARQYNPTTGRFLTTDPVPGGNANTYTYPTDPVNALDLTGMFKVQKCGRGCVDFYFTKSEVRRAIDLAVVVGAAIASVRICGRSYMCSVVLGIILYFFSLWATSRINRGMIFRSQLRWGWYGQPWFENTIRWW